MRQFLCSSTSLTTLIISVKVVKRLSVEVFTASVWEVPPVGLIKYNTGAVGDRLLVYIYSLLSADLDAT